MFACMQMCMYMQLHVALKPPATCTPFGVALAGRKSGLAHCQVTMGSGLVPLEDSVPIRQSLAYCPRGTCADALPLYALLAGHMSGSRMSGVCALPRWAPSAMALDLGRPLIMHRRGGGSLMHRALSVH